MVPSVAYASGSLGISRITSVSSSIARGYCASPCVKSRFASPSFFAASALMTRRLVRLTPLRTLPLPILPRGPAVGAVPPAP